MGQPAAAVALAEDDLGHAIAALKRGVWRGSDLLTVSGMAGHHDGKRVMDSLDRKP
jgi:hypothetical protein